MNEIDMKDFGKSRFSIASEAIGTTWSFEEFVRIHGEYEGVVVADSKRGIIEYGVFEDDNCKQIITCVSNVVKKYSGEEFEKNKANLEVVVLDSKMYCVCTKWEDVALYVQVNKSWSLLEFAKAHGKMQVGEFKDKETGAIFKACIFTSPSDGTRIFVAFSTSLGELTPKEIAAQKDELYVAQLESGNYSLYKKRNEAWEDISLDDDQKSGSGECEKRPAIDMPRKTYQSSRKNGERGDWMNLNEIKKEAASPYASLKNPKNIQGSSPSTRGYKNVYTPKGTKPTTIHYQAAFIAVLIAIVLGVSIYNSNMIRIEQDKILFLVMCCMLSIVAWGYPYFETSIKVDNDGCFEQGCLHPIIGVFGIVLFPLFIHYWIYKGIRISIEQLRRRFDS